MPGLASLWSRRWVRRSAAVAVAIGLVAGAAYTGYWFYAVKQIKAELAALAAAAKAQKIGFAWKSLATGGYPFRFRVELTDLEIDNGAGINATVPRLVASVQSGDFDNWRLGLPGGLKAVVAGANPRTLDAQSATGALSLRPDGGLTVWLTLGKSKAETGVAALGAVAFEQAITWLILPAMPPRAAGDPYARVAANLNGIGIAAPPPPFGKRIDNLTVGAAIMGPVPSGPFATAVSEWQRAGGTIKLEHCELAWDRLDVAGKGDVALDPGLQPNGSLAIQIAGYDQLLTALSVAGLLPQSDLTPMKIGLAMIGSAISTDLTVKDGDLFLGPANLGKAPRIEWQ
jgi:hypothetical protein